MSEISKPHSIHDDIEFTRGELFEDEVLRNSRKAEEALDRLVEQLEAAKKPGGWAAAEKAARRADELQEQLEASEKVVAAARIIYERGHSHPQPCPLCEAFAEYDSNPAKRPQ